MVLKIHPQGDPHIILATNGSLLMANPNSGKENGVSMFGVGDSGATSQSWK